MIINRRKYVNDLNDLNNKIKCSSSSPRIYIIGGVNGGGSLKFINDIKEQFSEILHIKTNSILQKIVFNENDILFIQHLVNGINPLILIEIKKKFNCRLILSVHDFYWFDVINTSRAYLSTVKISENIINLFKNVELVIHPSKFTYDEYSKYFLNNNFIISEHIDYKYIKSELSIPLIKNKTINIGVLHEFIECKGSELITHLMNSVKTYKEYKLNFYIVGQNIPKYNENEFFEYIKKYNIHCLTLLNKWGETYCYSLSKFLKSGLPIIYNNMGAIKERMPEKEYYFKVYDTEKDYEINNLILFSTFSKMIDYIILNQGKVSKNKIDLTLNIPPLYTDLFKQNKLLIKSSINNTLHKKNPYNVNVYCIYFPQFHQIIENDINFYKNYSDITNLNLFINENNIKQDTPSINMLPIKNNLDYDLEKNTELIQRQIELINEYNISGFALYYYWFSSNTITKKNMIMEKVINKFFTDDIKMYNRKVFFIWANESWSNNISFGNNINKNKIENIYNKNEFVKNIDNMLVYFKHDNYLKIDNKPVFFIHHPWFFTIENLDLFKILLDEKCINNKFNGCHLVINSMNGIYKNYRHYDHNFNYKNSENYKIENNQITLDYEQYVNKIISRSNDNIKTLVFNFDNRARLYKPNRLKNSTITINNNEQKCLKFMYSLYDTYKESKSDIDKIMLVNSWNEWGEQMAIEPSNEKGTYYLDLLKHII